MLIGGNHPNEYDAAGRLIRFTDPDGEVIYTYANGNILTVTDASGTITRGYDAPTG
ncbi:MAG: RHS repeat protein [Desulfuromonadales bacterium]|nr:RHS repeat protein [Desulfuromonadales bacterium]